jgi:hypothetical protein
MGHNKGSMINTYVAEIRGVSPNLRFRQLEFPQLDCLAGTLYMPGQ